MASIKMKYRSPYLGLLHLSWLRRFNGLHFRCSLHWRRSLYRFQCWFFRLFCMSWSITADCWYAFQTLANVSWFQSNFAERHNHLAASWKLTPSSPTIAKVTPQTHWSVTMALVLVPVYEVKTITFKKQFCYIKFVKTKSFTFYKKQEVVKPFSAISFLLVGHYHKKRFIRDR